MGQFSEVPCPTTRPQNEKKTTLYHWKIYPMLHPDRSPPGLTQDQPQKIYLRQEKTGQFPLLHSPHLPLPSKQKNHLKLQQSSMPWCCLSRLQRNAHRDHIAPFVRMRKSTKKIGMAIGRTNHECVPRILSAPSHRPFSAPSHRTIKILSHKTFSTPSHRTVSSHLTYPVGMLNK